MRRYLAAVTILGLVLAVPTAAAKPVEGGFGCFGPTLGFGNFDGLNTAFANADIEDQQLSSLHWMFGGAGYALLERVVIGGSGWGGDQIVASDSLRAKVSVSGGEFDIGYQVLSMKNLIVAPMLGIGANGYDIELQKLTGDVPNFDDLLEHPGRTSTVSTSSFLLNPHLMITIPISFVGIQLKGGWMFTPANDGWELADGARLNSGPAIAKGMPYASLNVVFGGFSKARTKVRVKRETDDD
jgi:hypothetical protein